MVFVLAFAIATGWLQAAKAGTQPRASATESAYLSCTTWTGKAWTNPTARSARTKWMKSPKGYDAYAEVKTIVKDGSCENTTTLYVATGSRAPYRIAYVKKPSESEGNGIRLIGWSPDGDRLLAEVNLWEYETDSGFEHIPLVYDASAKTAREIDASQALSHYFGDKCEFELAVEGWKTDEQLLIKVSRTPETDEYEQTFCVQGPRVLVFDLRNNAVKAESLELPKPH